eukprot:754753-Hanusia_phi.AAC.1
MRRVVGAVGWWGGSQRRGSEERMAQCTDMGGSLHVHIRRERGSPSLKIQGVGVGVGGRGWGRHITPVGSPGR